MRRIPQIERLEARLALSGQVAPIADPLLDPLPWIYWPEPPVPLDPAPAPLPSWVVDPQAPVEVPPPS